MPPYFGCRRRKDPTIVFGPPVPISTIYLHRSGSMFSVCQQCRPVFYTLIASIDS